MDYSTMALLIIIHVYINYDKKKNFHNLNFFLFFYLGSNTKTVPDFDKF